MVFVRLIVSIAFTVVSMSYLLFAIVGYGVEELLYPYAGAMLVAGGLLMWSKR